MQREATFFGSSIGKKVVMAVSGLVLLGFVIGVARLSGNWLVARLAAVYVELFRNIPLLLQIFFWYFAVLRALPGPRQSLDLGGAVYLNLRGLYLPRPLFESGFWLVPAALLVGLVASGLIAGWARRRQAATGRQFHSFYVGLGLTLGLPLLAVNRIKSPAEAEGAVYES